MRPLSEATSRVSSKNFSRKYIALGRIVNQWAEVMGNEFADKAQPVKIHYRKGGKNKKPTATLDIATSDSNATILNYQKGLILERLNRLFGDNWVTDIKFVASELAETPLTGRKINKPLSPLDKKYIDTTLDDIDDPEFKERLKNLGTALMMDLKK